METPLGQTLGRTPGVWGGGRPNVLVSDTPLELIENSTLSLRKNTSNLMSTCYLITAAICRSNKPPLTGGFATATAGRPFWRQPNFEPNLLAQPFQGGGGVTNATWRLYNVFLASHLFLFVQPRNTNSREFWNLSNPLQGHIGAQVCLEGPHMSMNYTIPREF